MGKFRNKIKGGSKGKRWSKGHSSSSNPETRKHRDQAKSRFFQENLGPSNLTSDALKRHDAIQALAPAKGKPSEETCMEEEAEVESSVGSTYQTMVSFASDWSNCSNMSFNRFLRVFRSDSALHKEMLAILAAITEVIKDQGGTETPTEYYCALLTTLEQIISADERNEDQITAVLSLLNMGIKTVPEAVLRTSFDDVSKKMLYILNEYSNSENNVIVKSVFGVLSAVLRAQEIAVWNLSSTNQIFSAVLNPFCIHSKPKWRKAAQQAVVGVVRASCFVNENSSNPAADRTAEFCKEILDIENKSLNVKANQTTILHLLGLMKETICHFSKANIKKCCEILLGLMTLNYPLVTSCGLQVLYALFSHQTIIVPSKLNAQLISALYEYQPAVTDAQSMLGWLTVMQQAHVHLADSDILLASASLPKIFSTFVQLWLSEKPQIATAATHGLECLLQDAVAPLCETPESVEQHKSKLAKCFNAIELGLGYQYHNVWRQVLHVIGVMFNVGNKNCSQLFANCLKSLAELCDSYKFSYNNELEHAIGAAVRALGPDIVLGVIPLKKENQELNIERSWLVPVLKENVRESTLTFWAQTILPMAMFCHRHSAQLQAANDGIRSHSYELLYMQLWNLLPSFCNKPTDITASFKSVAKILGMAISDQKELRLAVMAALRKLIIHAKESENADDISELTRFDKNYLPILFNIYTTKANGTDEEGQRLAALDTIKVYLTIAKPELKEQLFNNAMERLANTNEKGLPDATCTKESILDLIRVLVQYQKKELIELLYKQCIKSLPEIKDNKEQKKVYRLLEEICGSDAECCKAFIRNNRKAMQKLLMKALESSAISSKGARLRCLNYLVKAQPQLTHESTFLRSIVPEAVLCCKDINEKCRAAAFELLNSIGEILAVHDQMQEFITMLVAGLAGTPQVMSATILALSSILHNFTGALGKENIQFILENISQLMMAPTREVVGSCLSFIKVYCSSLPSPIVGSSLPNIIKALTQMTEDCKRHFRLKVRDILDRLVRKYGCDSIVPHIPVSDTVMHKRLRNLRKLNVRKKKQKEAADDQESQSEEEEFAVAAKPKSINEILADSDSELEEMETDAPKTGWKQKETWIQEDADSIVDFIDPKVVSKITASKPSAPALVPVTEKKNKNRGFKLATDGRLIIENDPSDSDSNKPKKRGLTLQEDSEPEHIDSDAETLLLSTKKRKRSLAGSVKSGTSSKSQPLMKYQAGGSGIHRPISTSSTANSRLGSEYKAKKAGGDIKKKGKVDPYAYVPLSRSLLNKRKKAKMIGQFKNIGKAAKSGARKGAKAKRLHQKK